MKASEITNFIIKFGVFSAVIFIFLSFFNSEIKLMLALASSLILNFFVENEVFGNILLTENGKFVIDETCSGILEISLILGAILATEKIRLRKRIIWSFFSLALILALNVFRIVVSIITFSYNKTLAFFVHEFLFRFFIFVSVALLYFVFLKFEKQ